MGRFILIKQHVDLAYTYTQVRVIELVRNVPAQRRKFAPLLNHRMEETQTKQKFPKWLFLIAAIEELGIAERIDEVGANNVGPETLGRLVGHLDRVLQHGDRKSWRRVRCEPEPKRRVHLVRV